VEAVSWLNHARCDRAGWRPGLQPYLHRFQQRSSWSARPESHGPATSRIRAPSSEAASSHRFVTTHQFPPRIPMHYTFPSVGGSQWRGFHRGFRPGSCLRNAAPRAVRIGGAHHGGAPAGARPALWARHPAVQVCPFAPYEAARMLPGRFWKPRRARRSRPGSSWTAVAWLGRSWRSSPPGRFGNGGSPHPVTRRDVLSPQICNGSSRR
jgi:hypothetical protein